MLKRRLCCLVTVLSLAAPYAAFAADPTPVDTAAQDVLFKNGSKVRGQVIDIMPGDHVTIRFKSGEARRFEWGDIDRVMPASGAEPAPLPPAAPKPPPTAAPTTAPTTAPPPVPTTAPPETLPPATGPTVKVHINSPVLASLQRRPRGGQSFLRACDAPCDMEMPLADDYMISAANSKTTAVKLNGQAGQTVIIDVDPPSDGGKIGGVAMIIVGALGVVVGGFVDFVGLLLEGASTVSGRNSADGVLVVGLVITGVSLGLGIGGVVVFFRSGNTDVTTKTGYLTRLPGTEAVDDRFVRAPVWHTPTAFERAAQGPARQTVPIFSRSF